MEFRDLKTQYARNKKEIDNGIFNVIKNTNFISGQQVQELEQQLAQYVGVKHCVTCANGTDALQLALMAWNIGAGDAVIVPDFTFFSSGEVVSLVGATPFFVDIDLDTYNMSVKSLQEAIQKIKKEGKYKLKAVISVDLFGQPAEYDKIIEICKKNDLLLLEDGAQGFGGRINDRKNCSFGDIATTSFFPAKPLGCYGDGGAIFTNDDEWAALLKSYRVHGKGEDKYDNIRIGLNSRLDTMQAAILQEKLKIFSQYELTEVNRVARRYSELLSGIVKTPKVLEGYLSSWAQYTILCENEKQRETIQNELKKNDIPAMIYYKKPMHLQKAFSNVKEIQVLTFENTEKACKCVLSLPMHPYLTDEEMVRIAEIIKEAKEKR